MSETFIQNQLAATRRYDPHLICIRRLDDGLQVPSMAAATTRLVARCITEFGYSRTIAHEMSMADIVHVHFASDAAVILPSILRSQRPFVVTCHGYDVCARPEYWPKQQRARWQVLTERAARFIAVSDFVASQLVSLGVPECKIVRVHIGIPLSSEITPVATSIRRGVLFVGRLVEKKGIFDCLEAVSRLEGRLNVTLTVIGDGPLRRPAERMSREMAIDAHFRGSQDATSVAKAMSESRALCVPCRIAATGDAEGFGMVFLEAANHGLPVVSYSSGGVPESVSHGQTGLLATKNDVDALARDLASVMTDDSLFARLSAMGPSHASRFEIGECAERLQQVYDEVLGLN